MSELSRRELLVRTGTGCVVAAVAGACGKDSDGMAEKVSRERLAAVWEEHVTKEFVERDVEATLATMTDDTSVIIVPLNVGGHGKEGVRVFYRDVLIPTIPEDMQTTPLSRTVGDGYVVDELRFSFTHARQMDWILPNVPPTNRRIDLAHVVVVEFRGDKVLAERVYWDQATVLRQAGLLGG
jgi:carboxymethylenebutenolidase